MNRFSIYVLFALFSRGGCGRVMAWSSSPPDGCLAFQPYRKSGTVSRRVVVPQQLASSRGDGPEAWLGQAAMLREQVQKLEVAAISRRSTNNLTVPKAASYSEVADSVWMLTYRFTDQPDSEATHRPRFFGGKMTVKIRRDGYCDLVSQEASGSATEACKLIKTWGWDVEFSKDIEKEGNEAEYLLFSVDAELPSAVGTDKTVQRFYFQARQDKDTRTGALSYADGTVTIKKDVVPKSTRWGLFAPGGILVQFRHVGNFVAKPVANT